MKLSDELKHCLNDSGYPECENGEWKSAFTCRKLLQKAYGGIKGNEEVEKHENRNEFKKIFRQN